MLKDTVPAQVFTFGFGHSCPCGRPLKNCYTILAGDFEEARAKMLDRWGRAWSNQYPTEDAAGVDRFKLTKVETRFDPKRCPCGDVALPFPEYRPIPVAEAHALAANYKKDIVVITAYDDKSFLVHTTTFAVKEEDKITAAKLGERIAEFVGADLGARTTFEDLKSV